VGYFPNPWVSSCYIISGAVLITVVVTHMIQKITDDASKHLFRDLKEREEYEIEVGKDRPFYNRAKAFITFNSGHLMIIILWVGWMAFLVVYSMLGAGFSFADAQYFAIALCSSAGSVSLPDNSATWMYGVTGIAIVIGVPLMVLAVSTLVMFVQGHRQKVQHTIREVVAIDELKNLAELGLGSNKTHKIISKEEFVLVCMIRLGTEPGLIQYICDVFDRIEQERSCTSSLSAPNIGGPGQDGESDTEAYILNSSTKKEHIDTADANRIEDTCSEPISLLLASNSTKLIVDEESQDNKEEHARGQIHSSLDQSSIKDHGSQCAVPTADES
jgi:hypothetical protein